MTQIAGDLKYLVKSSEEKFEQVGAKLEKMEKESGARFEKIDAKLEKIDVKLERCVMISLVSYGFSYFLFKVHEARAKR